VVAEGRVNLQPRVCLQTASGWRFLRQGQGGRRCMSHPFRPRAMNGKSRRLEANTHSGVATAASSFSSPATAR
jgi:hypothetical protein